MSLSKHVARWFWVTLGTFSLVLGVLGVFLPLLPTTPFLLLASFCYARSSPELSKRLLANRWLGGYIRHWQEGRGIPLKSKILAVLCIAIGIGYSALYVMPYLVGKIALVLTGCMVSLYIITRPTKLV